MLSLIDFNWLVFSLRALAVSLCHLSLRRRAPGRRCVQPEERWSCVAAAPSGRLDVDISLISVTLGRGLAAQTHQLPSAARPGSRAH